MLSLILPLALVIQVLTAAADALRVLLGRSSSELLLEEAAAANSSLGWPLTWRAQLRRLDAAGTWDTVENLVKAAQQVCVKYDSPQACRARHVNTCEPLIE